MIYPRQVMFPDQAHWIYVAPGTSLWRVIEMEAVLWRWEAVRRLSARLDEDVS